MNTHEPLNIWSMSPEAIGREMSNFAHTPFVLDGVEFGSVESFYVWLMLSASGTDRKRERVRPMWGLHAKRLFPKVRPDRICYRGTWIDVGGTDHLALIKRALGAKLEAHLDIALRFVATRPRRLVHETGYPDKPGAEFPKEAFCRLLCELRDEFAARFASEASSDNRASRD
jgi:predicted NAD-dependent protein-ADP-ribosyltransferase YbiA (DUF1768 family)